MNRSGYYERLEIRRVKRWQIVVDLVVDVHFVLGISVCGSFCTLTMYRIDVCWHDRSCRVSQRVVDVAVAVDVDVDVDVDVVVV